MADHFLVELFLQGNRRFHKRFGIRILRVQMRDNRRICFLTQPEIVVNHRVVVNLGCLGFLFSHGWLKGVRVGFGLCQAGSVKRQ
jgi:hypothetical protein